MKKFGVIVVSILVLLMALMLSEIWHAGSLRKRATVLSVGDDKAEVQRVLGRPTSVFTPPSDTNLNLGSWLLGVRSETWAYGSVIDLQSAVRGKCPLRFRFFGPNSDDVAVVFDSTGHVAQAIIPKP